ncbi:MAG: MFS transporter [Lentisphaeria bacterium]|nr:MFS transporter [Lentisphaeria bacterium]
MSEQHKLKDREIRAGLKLNIISGSLGASWFVIALGFPLTMLMQSLDVPGKMIGLVVTVQLLAMSMQIPGAIIFENARSRKTPWAVTTFLQRALWFLMLLLPFCADLSPRTIGWIIISIVALSSILGQSVLSLWFSWIADLVPQKISGKFWGTRHSICIAANMIAILMAGFLLDFFIDSSTQTTSLAGFAIVFGIAAFLGSADTLIHYFVPEPPKTETPNPKSIEKRIIEPLKERNFVLLTVAYALFNFSIGVIASFMPIYLKEEASASYSMITATVICGSIGGIVGGPLLGLLMDRLGSRGLAVILLILGPLCSLTSFFFKNTSITLPLIFIEIPQPLLIVCIANLFGGALYGGLFLIQIDILNAITPNKGRATAMAVHWTLVGTISAFGAILGGQIMDWVQANPINLKLPFGENISYIQLQALLHALMMWIMIIPLFLLMSPFKKEYSVGSVIRTLLIGNPLKSVNNILNAYMGTTALSRQKRMESAIKHGKMRNVLAVEDLIEQTEDPDIDVREQAIWALAQINTIEARHQLLKLLTEPGQDLKITIVRSLRLFPHENSVGVLLNLLPNADASFKAEIIRTLGKIGSPIALDHLTNILSHNHDTTIISASSHALANMGSIASIYTILPKMYQAGNNVLRRSMLIAIADMLIPKGDFYESLIKEKKEPGIELDRFLESIIKSHKKDQGQHKIQMDSYLSLLQQQIDQGEKQEACETIYAIAVHSLAVKYGFQVDELEKSLKSGNHNASQFEQLNLWYLRSLKEKWFTPNGALLHQDLVLACYVLKNL